MKQFFKFMFASMAGFLISGLILVFIFFSILFGVIEDFGSKFAEKPFEVEDKSVLHLTFNKPVVDHAQDDPFAELPLGPFGDESKMGLDKILKTIEKAKDDDKIKGIYLDVSGVGAGMATVDEIRGALVDFQESEKFVVAYSEGYSHSAYYLASPSDEIYLYPEGSMDWAGLRAELMFFKGAMEKLDIEAEIIRGPNNVYKSAVEPFMYDKMSDSSRVQVERFLGTIWEEMLVGISESRSIKVDKLNMIADSLLMTHPDRAVKYNFVDALKYEDEVMAGLREKLEIEEDEEINFVSLGEYAKAPASGKDEDGDDDAPKPWEVEESVAVIYATGGIQSGKGDAETIGSETVAGAIREARLDSNVKAIVLRVNSPGGSALASDVIWRETMLAKKKKPFVVSMGDVAASGGYYIACGADKIYANPQTITGSIGVFGMMPNLQGFWKNKLGITTDRVTTNAHSDIGSTNRAMTDMERNVIQGYVDDIYYDFIGKVAEGRGLTKDQVDQIARGRVWSGTDAIKKGLIDEFGGLSDAIAYAVEAAGLEEGHYKMINLPEDEDPFEEFMKGLSGDAAVEGVVQQTLGTDYELWKYLETVRSLEGYQALMPFFISIQ